MTGPLPLSVVDSGIPSECICTSILRWRFLSVQVSHDSISDSDRENENDDRGADDKDTDDSDILRLLIGSSTGTICFNSTVQVYRP